MKVIVADKSEAELIDGLKKLGCDVVYNADLNGDALAQALKSEGAQALIVRSTKVPGEALAAGADTLRIVIRAGSGYDNIDCDAAAAKGIAVCNTPGMNAVAVAELTMGHLISLDRFLPEQNAELKGGHWNKKKYSKARGLKGRTMLVVGAGAIGREVITRAKAFGMKVAAYDVMLTPDRADELGVEFIESTRDALLKALPRFDVVSIHVPAVAETKGMCDGAFFKAMRDGAYFINTSRGPVVDEKALAEAVSGGRIRAGLDVYNSQPADKDADWKPAIADVDGVYLSHHCGASTDQAQMAVAEEVVRMIGVFKETGRADHCVNAVATPA